MQDKFANRVDPGRVAEAFSQALAEARAYEGATAPNPPVGCVLLDAEGAVLAKAGHTRAGRPHAEAAALAACAAAGLTERVHAALVTLEPCSHFGRTPPCADALLATPVQQVWIGALDPHPRAPSAGMTKLRAAGVAIRLIAELDHPDALALSQAAARLIAPFAKWSRTGWPWVEVKTALDTAGGMIPPVGTKTFTSIASLTHAHRLRRASDAILTGSGCILADDPAFTVRHVDDHAGKPRHLVIMDRRSRVPHSYLQAARSRGFEVWVRDDLEATLGELGAAGVLSVLVEAGPTLRDTVLRQGLWDEEVTIRQSATPGANDRIDVRLREPLGAP